MLIIVYFECSLINFFDTEIWLNLNEIFMIFSEKWDDLHFDVAFFDCFSIFVEKIVSTLSKKWYNCFVYLDEMTFFFLNQNNTIKLLEFRYILIAIVEFDRFCILMRHYLIAILAIVFVLAIIEIVGNFNIDFNIDLMRESVGGRACRLERHEQWKYSMWKLFLILGTSYQKRLS